MSQNKFPFTHILKTMSSHLYKIPMISFTLFLRHFTQPFFFEGTTREMQSQCFLLLCLSSHVILKKLRFWQRIFIYIYWYHLYLCENNVMQIFQLIFCDSERWLLTFLLRKLVLILFFKSLNKLSIGW